jgi:8-oxo-dGTP pyrophosphatase MutT (NUDIX family)
VLLLLFPHDDQVRFVLTRRRDNLAAHAGQISLPGGRREDGESLQETALRETYEEVGIEPQSISILGRLAPLYIPPSDFEVHPFVGWREERPAFVPQLSEVAEIIEAPLSDLLDDSSRREEVWERNGMSIQVPFFQINSHKVWGATAMVLSEFAERIRSQIDGNLATVR